MNTAPIAPRGTRGTRPGRRSGRRGPGPNPTARAILDELRRRPGVHAERYVDEGADVGPPSGGTVVAGQVDSPVVVYPDQSHHNAGPVLVALDDDENPAALTAYGRAEAQRRGVALRTVYVWTDCRPPDCDHHRTCNRDLGDAVRMLSQIIEEHLAPDDASDLERDVLHDTDPAQALAALSATASLLVLGAASRRPDGEGVLGDTTRGLVVRARCPLAVVPQHADLYRVTRPRAA